MSAKKKVAQAKGKKKGDGSIRMVILSDLHCGHAVGLTPPEYHYAMPKKKENNWRYKVAKVQRETWNWWEKDIAEVREEKPIDLTVLNGDAIDGRGEKSGGTELTAVDRFTQADMAVTIMKMAKARKYKQTYGTGYHTGNYEDYEDYICKELGNTKGVEKATIGDHAWVNCNGTMFDFKHHVGGSGTPYGQFTPVAKDKVWNSLWSLRDEQPNADVIIRSHVHTHTFCGEYDWLAITTPALQGMGSKFGSRRCSKRINIGYLVFDIAADGSYTWQSRIARLKCNKVTVDTV